MRAKKAQSATLAISRLSGWKRERAAQTQTGIWPSRVKSETIASRRSVLSAIAAATGASLAAGCVGPGKETKKGAPAMKRLGIQLYMMGDEMAQDVPGTLKSLAAIGYREVEFAQMYGKTPEALRSDLDAAGIKCTSAHIPLDSFAPGSLSLQNVDAVVSSMRTLGGANVVVPIFEIPRRFLEGVDFGAMMKDMQSIATFLAHVARSMTRAEWSHFAAQLNQRGETLSKAGMTLGYHNHNLEFAPLDGGGTPLDLLIAETDPRFVRFELDVGWAAAAGVNPATFLNTHRSRVNQLHLKDVASKDPTFSSMVGSSDLGEGIVDWPELLSAIDAAEIDHVYVEQEEPFRSSRLDAAKHAYKFLTAHAR